jgi:hypothetical protein
MPPRVPAGKAKAKFKGLGRKGSYGNLHCIPRPLTLGRGESGQTEGGRTELHEAEAAHEAEAEGRSAVPAGQGRVRILLVLWCFKNHNTLWRPQANLFHTHF